MQQRSLGIRPGQGWLPEAECTEERQDAHPPEQPHETLLQEGASCEQKEPRATFWERGKLSVSGGVSAKEKAFKGALPHAPLPSLRLCSELITR